MSKYHNAGIWSMDYNVLRFMFKTYGTFSCLFWSTPGSWRDARGARICDICLYLKYVHSRHLKYVHSVFALTHWNRDEIDAILKTTFTNALSGMKMYWFRLKFHCNLFRGPINNIASLIQIMAWRRSGDKPLSEPMLVRSLTHIRITRPQWVKTWYLYNWHILPLTTVVIYTHPGNNINPSP